MRRSVPQHFLRNTEVKRWMISRSRPNVLANDEVEACSGHMTKLCSCMYFYGAYNYSGLVRQVSGFSNVSVSA